ncbi:hypothetical protein TNCV_10461 [Trichonephila clavipes]|nr:hypothetical protein TNCV_10461 [Trichonephila clavipes]
MIELFRNTAAIPLFFLMLHCIWFIMNVQWRLNVECAVRPPSSKVAAMPDDATANAIFCCDRILARINDIKNVLPVPPGASKKKTALFSSNSQHNPDHK